MPKIELSKDEESLLTYLSRKTGPVYVMEQDIPALHLLHDKGFVAINGNVGLATEEGKEWLASGTIVVQFQDDTFGGNEKLHQQWLDQVGVKSESKEPSGD